MCRWQVWSGEREFACAEAEAEEKRKAANLEALKFSSMAGVLGSVWVIAWMGYMAREGMGSFGCGCGCWCGCGCGCVDVSVRLSVSVSVVVGLGVAVMWVSVSVSV